MSKNSPEQYLKYLTALSLAVTASAGAQTAIAAPAETSATGAKPSANLEAMAAVVAEENAVPLWEEMPGCAGWPESTYVRRAEIRDGEPGQQSSNLEALVDTVVKESAVQLWEEMPGCAGWPESTYVRRAEIRDAERQSGAVEPLESLIEDVVGDLS
jgi:hypothetical protein